MKDSNSFDKQESFRNNIDFNNNDNSKDKRDICESGFETIKQTISKYGSLIEKKDDCIMSLVDSYIQIDGSFFQFCKDNNFAIKALCVDIVSVSPITCDDYDPFVANGAFLIDCGNFSFIKASLLCKAQGSDNAASFVLINKNDYSAYLEFKTKYGNFLKERDGVVVKVIGGEDYSQSYDYNWDKLFFGEMNEQKELIKSNINKFLGAKDLFNKNNIPWNMSILIQGPRGCGKSTLINTLISEYNLDPYTIDPCNVDDGILVTAFNGVAPKYRSILFIDDVDELIEQQFITADNLLNCINVYNGNYASFVVMTCRKCPDVLKDYCKLNIDLSIDIGLPDYNESITTLFGNIYTAADCKYIQNACKKAKLSYQMIEKFYSLCLKNIIYNNSNEYKDILSSLVEENEKQSKPKTKKIGIGLK